MEDQEIEYKGVGIIVNSKVQPDGSWIATFTLHEDQPSGNVMTTYTLDPYHGSTRAAAEEKAVRDARQKIDKQIEFRKMAQDEKARQAALVQDRPR
jgi:hypothetical protein